MLVTTGALKYHAQWILINFEQMFEEKLKWGKERRKQPCEGADHCSGQSSTLWPINQKNTLGQVFYWNWDWDYLIWQNWPKKQSILWQEKQFCDSKKDGCDEKKQTILRRKNKHFETKKTILWQWNFWTNYWELHHDNVTFETLTIAWNPTNSNMGRQRTKLLNPMQKDSGYNG